MRHRTPLYSIALRRCIAARYCIYFSSLTDAHIVSRTPLAVKQPPMKAWTAKVFSLSCFWKRRRLAVFLSVSSHRRSSEARGAALMCVAWDEKGNFLYTDIDTEAAGCTAGGSSPTEPEGHGLGQPSRSGREAREHRARWSSGRLSRLCMS